MPRTEAPLTLERILCAAEDTLRRFGPDKATVVDVARALGVSHAAVYRHVPSKAALRDGVLRRWLEGLMPPQRRIANGTGPAADRLRAFVDTLVRVKRERAAHDPEVFAAYRTLAAGAQQITDTHVKELISLMAQIVAAGMEEGVFRSGEPTSTAEAVLLATARFHHPAHAAEWQDAGLPAAYESVWQLILRGLNAGG